VGGVRGFASVEREKSGKEAGDDGFNGREGGAGDTDVHFDV